MAEERVNLSEEDQERVVAWIQERWTRSKECPIDGSTQWEVSSVAIAAPVAHVGVGVDLARVYPIVPVTCSTCGYTVFFGGVKVGLFPPEVRDGE